MIWPALTGKSSVGLAVAGATAVTVMPARLRAADTAGLTTTSVLLPITVAEAGAYAVVVDVFELVSLVAAVLLLEPLLLLELLPQAATTSPAATITATADSREQLRSMRPSPLLNCPGFPRTQ
jgi:hypothetical protein